MSYVIDTANKINDLQLQAVIEGQKAVVDLVKKTAAYVDRSPEAPESVQKLVEPFKSVVGAPADLLRSLAQSNKEWTQAWLDFHTEVAEVLAPVAERGSSEPTPIKKSDSARGAKA